jgi:hypothetical protein
VNSSRPGCFGRRKVKTIVIFARRVSRRLRCSFNARAVQYSFNARSALHRMGHASLRNLPESQRSQYKKVLIGPITCCRFPSGVLPVLHRYTDEIGWQLTYILRLDLDTPTQSATRSSDHRVPSKRGGPKAAPRAFPTPTERPPSRPEPQGFFCEAQGGCAGQRRAPRSSTVRAS